MADILERIVATKWREIAEAKARTPLRVLESLASEATAPRGFEARLRVPGEVRVIAEVKKASPSAGIIRADFDPASIAKIYEANGATALSVLTDEDYFQGHLDFLIAARATVSIPVLRKEFILDEYQIVEARAAGADAILLIAEILPGERLCELHRFAKNLGLGVLVELHDADQLPRVLDCGATLIGINNRDLRTFETRLELTLELRPKIPAAIAVVGESGIRNHSDLKRLAGANVQAVLVGESLMRAPDIGRALRELLGE